MYTEVLIAVLCCVAFSEISAKAVKAANSVGLIDNVSAESVPQQYRNVYSYASANPYAAYSFHVPQFVAPNFNQIVPLNQERILAQSTNNYLRDSYGQRLVEAPQAYAYKAALPQQFVPLQKLPAHLSQPFVAAAPNAQYGQATHFFGTTPFRLANLQAISNHQANPFGAQQPLVYAQNVRTLVAAPASKPQANGQPVAQQQSTSNNNVYANILKAGQYNQFWKEPNPQIIQGDPKISASDHQENQQSLPLVHAPKQTTITSFTNGKKTVVNLITKPPVPLLDLTLLEPLTFDNPLVPQVQHFLPKIHSVTYKKLPELNQKKVVTIKRKTTKKIKKQKKPKIAQDEIEVNHTPTISDVKPEISYEINSPNYKETYTEKKLTYNKETQSKPVHVSYEKKTEMKPVTYSYGKHTQKEPVHYNYVHNSNEPAKLKQAYLEDNKEKTKHLIYHFSPEEQSDVQNEENNSESPIESVEIYEDDPNESDSEEGRLQQQQHEHQQVHQHQQHQQQQQHQQHQHQQHHEPQHQQHHEPQHQQHHEPQHQQYHENQAQNHHHQHHQPQQQHKQHHLDYNKNDGSHHGPQHEKPQHQQYHPEYKQQHDERQHHEPLQRQHHEPQQREHHEPQQNQYQQHKKHDQKQKIHDNAKHELAEEAYNQPDQNYREEPEPEHREVAYYENSKENVEPEHRQDAYYENPKNAYVEAQEESPEPIIHKSSPQQEEKQYEAIVPEYEEDITILPTHKPHAPIRGSNNKHRSHPEPQSEEVRYDYPKSYYSSPVSQEKSNRIIIKDDHPKPPQEIYKPNDELIEAMVKKQEESEDDFEQAYKDAAYGFPAYESSVRNTDKEKEIYNPANYGVARFHNDFDGEKSQLRQYEAEGDEYPTQMRSNYKDTRDKTNENYYTDYADSGPQSLIDRKKQKEQYYDSYNEHKPQKYYAKDDSDNQQSAKFTVGSSFSYPGAPQKQYAKFTSRITPLDEYNYGKEKPSDSSAFGTGTYSKTQFLEPHYQYGFEPIRVSRLLDRELAAMASDHSPETIKKMYKENYFIEKSSTSKGEKLTS
ncbi:jg10974 [Pararge aegeria aegeria]|uniref:Jg10974 protein n=1 Tax=Pararge aegeria aegeria TaxID=348720 RepID=A0A8S4SCW8_9NEOP|nr:jg10974 [Pararge aegeria aegeria]